MARRKKTKKVEEEIVEQSIEPVEGPIEPVEGPIEPVEEPAFEAKDVSEEEDAFSTLNLPASSPDSRLDTFNSQSVFWRGKAIDEGIV